VRDAWGALRRSLADPGLLRMRAATPTFVTALLGGLAASGLATLSGAGISLVVFAMMLSLNFTAQRAGAGWRNRLVSLTVLVLTGLAAAGVGVLLVAMPWLGATLFVLVLSGAIYVRRFGSLASRLGTLVSLPFITVLVVPLPITPGRGFAPWTAVMALIVGVIALTVQALARTIGMLPAGASTTPPSRRATQIPPSHPEGPTKAVATRQGAEGSRESAPNDDRDAATRGRGGRDRRGGRTLPASTRMAVQMAVTLAAAFLIGHLVFGEHWFWAVLTAYIVAAGNRGRGDVLAKGLHRTVGALGGTVLAVLVSLIAPAAAHAAAGTSEMPGASMHEVGTHAALLVIAIGVILALGLWLRPAGYGWWAAAMTAMLSLLHELTGTAPGPVMLIRLAAIVTAGALAIAVAWWVLPVRTGDVLRRRTADALRALTELLRACVTSAAEPDALAAARAHLTTTVAALDQLAPTLRLEWRARRHTTYRARLDAAHRADVIPAVRACLAPADAIAAHVEHGHPLDGAAATELGGLGRRLGGYRRMLGGLPPTRPNGSPQAPPAADSSPAAPPRFAELASAVAALREPLTVIAPAPHDG
jgi:hypothetical protein